MRIAMVGLGRMGANMVRRLLAGGHECIAFDHSADAVKAAAAQGAQGVRSLAEMVQAMRTPRAVWIMVPAGVVDAVIADLRGLLKSGDIIIDGGNSHYHDDIRRAEELKSAGIHYVDVGTSGGVLGFDHGFSLMIGGETEVVSSLEPVFATLSPGGRVPTESSAAAPRSAASAAGSSALRTAAMGYLHCGPAGAGHFVKMVHNGIEYGLMAAYGEGLNLLKARRCGAAEAAE